MYTDVHINPEPESIQATNCLSSMQEYQWQKTSYNFSTYTIGNIPKKTSCPLCEFHHRLKNNQNFKPELDKIAPCLSLTT